MKATKEQKLWGVTYSNNDQVMPDTIRRTRMEAQKACCDNRYQYREMSEEWKDEWRRWKKIGCKAVKVVVRRET